MSLIDADTIKFVKVLDPRPRQGPDAWPYLLVSTEEGDEPLGVILDWLKTQGVGLVIDPQKEEPDFVYSYGMVWNCCERGEFISENHSEATNGQVSFNGYQEIYVGHPSESYLPLYVRSIFKEFFKQQGLEGVKINMVSKDKEYFDLAFSLESLGNPRVAEHKGLLEALSWFLPRHYSLILASEKNIPGFVIL